ncbi:hypothetical protein [Prosthecobacter dejongeii]|uniref:Uncharacterized protein n=1 Tax=Prosthecobacter dejongeii TaxID=48465 RepID=A0A7W7YJD0_9BACT|nr:hypothetical protein [Prosthecobacter dejongeii]MBB5037273.1 hypothetical protein [Prosthecobacter dejongeii]
MKTVSKLRSNVIHLAAMGMLLTAMTSCELPPRDAWRIIQRDGLLTYWDREYQPQVAPSRYLNPNGRPFQPVHQVQVPYRPESSRNRYLAEQPRVYRAKPRAQSPRRSQPSRVVTEAPVVVAPKIPLEAATQKTEPKVADAPKLSMETLPYGTPVAGRPGMVTSPFAEKQQLVDVTGMAAGEAVKDPYSGKLFRVPPTQQAAATKTEPSTPEKLPTVKDEAKPQP